MEPLINGAGAFVAFSAPPMIIGLLIRREGRFAILLRHLAIFMALAIPLVFMAVGSFFVPAYATPQYDFDVNHRAAIELYAHGGDPYSVHAAYSFPFPTFYVYWILGGFDKLPPAYAWFVWWAVNAAVWLICVVLLWRSLPRPETPREWDMMAYTCVAIPAITTLWQGQTALLILFGLVLVHLALQRSMPLLGGIGLAWAALIKPQLALVGLGIALWALLSWRENRSESRRTFLLLVYAAITAILLIALTLILPGGVTLDTYRNFVSEALPQVARPADGLVIGSPAFVAAAIAYGLGASDRVSDLVATIMTVIMVGIALFWTWQRRKRPASEIAAGWGLWAMVIPRIAWTWYAAWCLPFFLILIRQRRDSWLLMIVLLALLSLQPGSLIIAFATILGLIYSLKMLKS